MLVFSAFSSLCFRTAFVVHVSVLSLSLHQIRTELQKGLQQHDETTSQALIKFEQRVNNIRVDLNLLEEQINQRMTHVSDHQ